MALTIKCPHCEKTLGVPAEAVGKMVRCPACQTAFPIAPPTQGPASPTIGSGATVPAPRATNPGAPPPEREKESISTRRKRTEEAEERKKKRHGEKNEQEPDRKKKKQQDDQNPFALQDEDGRIRLLGRPHRGGLILVLGILSFLGGCFILAFITISMANVDLIQMAARRMDPSGKTMTQVGKYLAMANLALSVLVFALGSCVGLVFFVWR
jgi:phage FluMu protein Com